MKLFCLKLWIKRTLITSLLFLNTRETKVTTSLMVWCWNSMCCSLCRSAWWMTTAGSGNTVIMRSTAPSASHAYLQTWWGFSLSFFGDQLRSEMCSFQWWIPGLCVIYNILTRPEGIICLWTDLLCNHFLCPCVKLCVIQRAMGLFVRCK